MKILEVYPTVQGEGIDIGREAIFVRTAGCSVGCVWCDTKHSWEFGKQYEISVSDLLLRVEEITQRTGIKDIVFTGGEPMQQRDSEIEEFFLRLSDRGYWIAVETSGIKLPTSSMVNHVQLWTVSPKLSSAQPKVRVGTEELSDWVYDVGRFRFQLKFVIQTEKDLEEAVALIRPVQEIRDWHVPVILQPEESMARETFHNLQEWLPTHWTERSGYNLRIIPQVHKLIGIP